MRVLLVVLVLTLSACGNESHQVPKSAEIPAPAPTIVTPSSTPGPSEAPGFRCDPGFGFPRASATCPDAHPLIGVVTALQGDIVTVQRVRVYVTDAEGKAYAREHGLEYPFSNDYFQVEEGEPRSVEMTRRVVCTGVIVVGYREPLADHVVPCQDFARARVPVTAAFWFEDGRLVQMSELYRP